MGMGGGGPNISRSSRSSSRNRSRTRGRATVLVVAGVVFAAALILVLALTGGSDESGSSESDPGGRGSSESGSGENEGFNPAVSGGEVTGSAARAKESQESGGDDSESQEVAGEREEPERHADHDEEYVALTESQKGRARLAAIDFILAAYGYPKDDWARYSEQIRPEVDWGVFYESAAGDEISERIETMRQGGESGLQGAVVVERFEVLGVDENEESGESEEVSAVAYFEAAESFSSEGEPQGRATYYRQKMTLTTDGATYLVSSAEVPEATDRG